MGSGYNTSLAVGRGARNKASTRTPVHFWLDVPMYEYDLGCGTNATHTFVSRTPIVAVDDEDSWASFDDKVQVWCERCQEFREIDPDSLPINEEALALMMGKRNDFVDLDDFVSYEQDKGIRREAIAHAIQDIGYLNNDTEITELAIKYGVPVGEIKRINAGLTAPDKEGKPDLCKAGLHEMTVDNTLVRSNGRRQCRACWNLARKKRRAAGSKD